MRYPDSVLAPGETVVVHRHPHWTTLVVPLLLWWSAVAAACFLAAIVSDTDWEGLWRNSAFGVLAAATVLVVGPLCLRPWLRWSTTHYVVTDRRVLVRRGVIHRCGQEMALARVDAIHPHWRLVDRLTRAGSLVIESAVTAPVVFDRVPRVNDVHRLLFDEVFGADPATVDRAAR